MPLKSFGGKSLSHQAIRLSCRILARASKNQTSSNLRRSSEPIQYGRQISDLRDKLLENSDPFHFGINMTIDGVNWSCLLISLNLTHVPEGGTKQPILSETAKTHTYVWISNAGAAIRYVWISNAGVNLITWGHACHVYTLALIDHQSSFRSNDVEYKYNYTPGDAIQNALLLNEEQAKAPKELLELVEREFTMEKFFDPHCVAKKYELKMQMEDTVIQYYRAAMA